jgi:putative flippase GtrA
MTKTLFSSDRERRLWTWTLVVVVAIYSTLGLARTLAGMLRDRGLLNATFVLGMALIGLAVVALGLKIRPRGAQIGVALGVAAVYLLVLARMGVPEERSHLIEYSVVAAFIHEALIERRNQGRHVPLPGLLAIVATTLVGVVDECIQLLLPSRVFDWFDMLFNFLAALMAVSAGAALRWARGRWPRRGTSQDPSG